MAPDLQLREFRASDGPALLALWNAAAPIDAMSDRLFSEKVWDDPDGEDGCRLIAQRSQQPVGFVFSVVRSSGERPVGYVKLIATEQASRRLGAGRLLLSKAEEHAWRRGAAEVRIAEGAPNYLTPGVDARCADAIEFFTHAGYETVGRAVNMGVNLHALPAETPHDPSFTLARAEPSDAPALNAFLAEHWPPWRGEAQVALANQPATLFLAREGNQILGFTAYESNNRGVGWFGPMGTAPAARGRGVGRALLLRALHAMRAAGFAEAVIPWVGPVEFYESCVGARVTREFVRLRKVCPRQA